MNYKKQYVANPERYAEGVMNYRTCGASGIRHLDFGGILVASTCMKSRLLR